MDRGLTLGVIGMISILAIAVIIKGAIEYFSRKQLITKGIRPGDFGAAFDGDRDYRLFANVKWGFICIGLGLSLLARDIFPDLLSDTGNIGLMFIGAGVGFLCYFFVAKKSIKQKTDDEKTINEEASER